MNQRGPEMGQDVQHLKAWHQFLLSGEAGVTTSATTYDKGDEALVKVVRLCSSLKPLDINVEADGQRRSEGRREEGKETKNSHGFEMTDLGERSGEGWEKLMVSICLGMLGEKSNAGLLEEEEANKHMIWRSHPGTEMWLAEYDSNGKRQLGDTRDHRLCEANDLCASVRKLI